MNGWFGRIGLPLGSRSVDLSKAADDAPDLSRRFLLTGAAAVACAAVVALPGPASAQGVQFYFGGGHGRRESTFSHNRERSRWDSHSRRRSREMHSRRRSEDHGRRRSRQQFRDWNEDCILTPVGWFCF